ncbi:MAG: biotin--[acetyl-CoA-carboxylase] ligase, partial [Candidatus Eremiobacteraeota bacterium]|nr:biotin--[acetyl-CoA-carboxylase] ligase [Candidatus Eremiobacteraeota bacterium]
MESGKHPYESVRNELAGTPFAAIRYIVETGSTNADAAKLLGDDEYLGASIVAEHQSRGRGRKGRTWTSQPGSSLLVTTILPHAVATTDLWAVPFWAALAVHAALAEHAIVSALCWPNDVLLDGRGKVAGILCASTVTGNAARVACGVGINVRRPASTASIDPHAAFCDDVKAVDRAALLRALLQQYDARLDLLASTQRTAAHWETAAGLPGARYRILKDGTTQAFDAIALRLAHDGALVVERAGREET